MLSSLQQFFETRKPGSPFLFTLIVIIVVAVGWGNDYQSCRRSEAVRSSLRISYEGTAQRAAERARIDQGAARLLDLEARAAALRSVERVHRLGCLSPFPPA